MLHCPSRGVAGASTATFDSSLVYSPVRPTLRYQQILSQSSVLLVGVVGTNATQTNSSAQDYAASTCQSSELKKVCMGISFGGDGKGMLYEGEA
ncbi:hypothetical protein GN244_ATG09179 [Phytophthora infestans]|uniref:Uncharacterized protein n=1 Tax=Phytophthora infestans TaxID=4787 RepID=A0A833T8J0_PHYIN|nr:hypothetical protein GN244_ATG09179 [Phytophthora infestans]KAF4142541.1 hypothetical protein GN958_ATG08272 [Phytophthora infestans]